MNSTTDARNDTKSEDTKEDSKKTVGKRYIDRLYSRQSNSLDVRWQDEETLKVSGCFNTPATFRSVTFQLFEFRKRKTRVILKRIENDA